jgi:hypothetical protein
VAPSPCTDGSHDDCPVQGRRGFADGCQHPRQAGAISLGEGGHHRRLQGDRFGDELVDQRPAGLGDRDEHASPVVWVGRAGHEAAAFEGVEQ